MTPNCQIKMKINILLVFCIFCFQIPLLGQCELPPLCEEEKILSIDFNNFQFMDYDDRICNTIPDPSGNMPCSSNFNSTFCTIIESQGSNEPLPTRKNYALCVIVDIPECSYYQEFNWTGADCTLDIVVPSRVTAEISIKYYESCGTCNEFLHPSREVFFYSDLVMLNDEQDPQNLLDIELWHIESIFLDKCE